MFRLAKLRERYRALPLLSSDDARPNPQALHLGPFCLQQPNKRPLRWFLSKMLDLQIDSVHIKRVIKQCIESKKVLSMHIFQLYLCHLIAI